MLKFAIALLFIAQTVFSYSIIGLETTEGKANVTKVAKLSLPEDAYGGLHFMDILALRNMRNKRNTDTVVEETDVEVAENRTTVDEAATLSDLAIALNKLVDERDALKRALESQRNRHLTSTQSPKRLQKVVNVAKKVTGTAFKHLGSALAAAFLIAFREEPITALATSIAIGAGLLSTVNNK